MKITVSGGQFFADGFALRRAFTLEEGESRLISYLSNEGCGCAAVRLENGALTCDGALLAIEWKTGWELRPDPRRCGNAVKAIDVRASEGDYRVECRPSNCEIRVTGEATAIWKSKTSFSRPVLTLIEGQKHKIVEITADHADGKYIAMISLAKGDARLLLEDYGESVTCQGNEVIVKRRLRDLCEREVTATYLWRGEWFSVSREVILHSRPVPDEKNVGRLLLESVIAKDGKALCDLLTHDIADENAVFDYFGEVLGVETPSCESSPAAVAALIRKGEKTVGVIYDFDLDGEGRICNVRCLDDE